MSVLAKGMDMPKEGNETIIRIQPNGSVLDQYGDHLAITAVSVPPHGRLIDADKLYKWIKAECNPYGKPTIGKEDGMRVIEIIEACHTVIEAEE